MGMITLPLLHTIRTRPSLLQGLLGLWEASRRLGLVPIADQERECSRLKDSLWQRYAPLRNAIIESGVPTAVSRVLENCRTAAMSSPPALRALMREMTGAFADRLRRCSGAELLTVERIERALSDAVPGRACMLRAIVFDRDGVLGDFDFSLARAALGAFLPFGLAQFGS